MAGLVATPLHVSRGTAKFDLSLAVTEQPAGLDMVAEYSTDLFEAPTVERLLGHFVRLLESAVTNPDRPISSLPLLSDGRDRPAELWSGEPATEVVEECLHHLLAARAARQPDAVAVVSAEGRLTYMNSSGGPTRWPATSAGWAPGPTSPSAYAWPARATSRSRSTASSRRAGPICPSTPTSPSSGCAT